MIAGDQFSVLAPQLLQAPLGGVEVGLDAVDIGADRLHIVGAGLGRQSAFHVS